MDLGTSTNPENSRGSPASDGCPRPLSRLREGTDARENSPGVLGTALFRTPPASHNRHRPTFRFVSEWKIPAQKRPPLTLRTRQDCGPTLESLLQEELSWLRNLCHYGKQDEASRTVLVRNSSLVAMEKVQEKLAKLTKTIVNSAIRHMTTLFA